MNVQPLFHQPDDFKKAAAYKLPGNPKLWQTEIAKHLASQHPYLELEDVQINFRHMDAVKGAAVGAVVIPEKEIAIPIIIKRPGVGADPELSPLDVFLHKGAALHLNPQNIKTLTHKPQIGEPTSNDYAQGGPRVIGSNPYIGDLTGDASPLEYSGQASPFAGPFDAFSVKAGSLVEGMCKHGFIHPNDLTNFRKMLASNPQLLQGASNNLNLIDLLMKYKQPAAVPHAPNVVRPNILQVWRDRMTGKLNYKFSGGQETAATRGELQTMLGDKYPEAMAKVDSTGVYMIAEEINRASWETKRPPNEARPILGDGLYMVRGRGNDTYHGFVCQRMMRLNGESLPVKLFVTTDGRYAISGELFGVKLTRKNRLPARRPVAGQTGVFVSYIHGSPIASVPLRIINIVDVPTQDENKSLRIFNVVDPVTGEKQSAIPYEGVLGYQRMIDIEPTAMSQTRGDIYYIPADVDWVTISQPVAVAQSSDQLSKLATAAEQFSETHVAFNGAGFYVESKFSDKVANFEVNNLSEPSLREVLVSMGMDVDNTDEVIKFARDHRGMDAGANLCGLLPPQGHGYSVEKKADPWLPSQDTTDFINSFRVDFDLLKSAAESDGETLDAMLSLHFVTPQNARYFVDHIETFEDIVSRLAALLVSVRLGMKHVKEQAVKDSMEGLSRVVSQLRLLKSAMDHERKKEM